MTSDIFILHVTSRIPTTLFKLIMKYLSTVLLTLFTITLFAQAPATGSISGMVNEPATGKPVIAATIQVFNFNDSLLLSTVSSKDGSFLLKSLPRTNDLFLSVTAIGFAPYDLAIDWAEADKKGNIGIGKIEMIVTANALDEVVVTGRRKAFEMKLDKRVFNPDAQITAKGGTGVDVLKNIPSVSVDAQGGVELRGSSPQIFVDGRPTILTIEQIAADDIERVEVITNPSSKYDAASSGGIINIVLKKNKARGLNGNVSAGIGYPSILNSYLGLNYRQGKVNYFVTGNYNQSGGLARGETDRTNLENGVPTSSFSQVSENDRLRKNRNVRFGVDYFIDDKNTITVSQGFSGGTGRSIGEQSQTYFDENKNISGTGTRDEIYNWNFNNTSTQFFYKRTFSKMGREITGDFTYNQGSNANTSSFINELFEPGSSTPSSVNRVRNEGGSENDQFTFQVDYVNPYGENGKLEAGLRYFTNDYTSFFNAFSVNGGSESKLPFSNNIAYKERIGAGYLNYGNKIEKWGLSYQAGLRVELSDFKGVLLDSNKSFGYEYPGEIGDILKSIFPSLYLTKDLSKNTQLQLNYSRRIRRPNFWQLNPFVDISDPLNVRQGNINLIPETIHAFELNFNNTYDKGNFMISAYYRNNVDDITRYSDTITQEQLDALDNAAINPNAILNTFINADFTNRLGLEFNLQHKFNERFDIMPSVNFQYRHVKAQVGELNLDNKGFNWETQLTANYRVISKKKLLDKFSFQLTGEYESPEVIPQGRTIAETRMDVAIRKDFLKNNKATLVFAIDDVFNSRRWGQNIETPRFKQESYSRWNVRQFKLTFSYRFGSNDFQFLNKRKGGGDDGGGEG